MPLGKEVGLGPGDTVLDGDPDPPRKVAHHNPTFRPMSIVTKQSPIAATAEFCCIVFLSIWIKMPLAKEVGLGPGDTVLHGDPDPPRAYQPPTFRPMSIVTKRSPISATAELLLYRLPLKLASIHVCTL